MHLAQDHGPDGHSAVYALGHKENLKLNVGWIMDFSHGVKCDVENSYKSINMQPFTLLMMIVFNMGHGPDKDEGMRWAQLQESLEWLFDVFGCGDFPLFEARHVDIVEEMGDELEYVDGEEHLSDMERAWNALRRRRQFEKKGRKVIMARFMAWLRGGKELLRQWSWTLFRSEWLALEHDFLQGSALMKKIILPQRELAEDGSAPTTSSHATSVDAKLLRSCCQNAVTITCLVLGERKNRRSLAILVHVPEPVERLHGESAKECKVSRRTTSG